MGAKRTAAATTAGETADRLIAMGKALTSSLNLPEVFNAVIDVVERTAPGASWALLLHDEDRQQLRFEIVVGEHTEALQGSWLPLAGTVAGWVLEHREMAAIADVTADERSRDSAEIGGTHGARSLIALPLLHAQRAIGVLELRDFGRGKLAAQQHQLLTALCDFAAVGIENARAMQRARELTVTDDVTSLYNARFLQQTLEQEFRRSRRYGTPVSLIFIDLDYFKHINDTYGHLVGSDVLRETALILRESLRVTDIATRYGGDEFVLVLPETSQDEAIIVANRCRDAIKAFVFGQKHGASCRITASFGVATLPDDTGDKMDLLRLADQAMYWVKEHNRDNIATAAAVRDESVGERS